MAESSGQEKTEQATGKKLEDSREKGQAAKSMEINSLAIFTSGIILLIVAKEFLGGKLSSLTIFIFDSLDKLTLSRDLVVYYSQQGYFYFIIALSPFFIGLVIVAIAAGYGQVGFKITPKALEPKFSKLDPIKGIKNKFFSSSTFVETIKSIVKLSVISLFTYFILESMIFNSVGLVELTVAEIVENMIDSSFTLLYKIAIIFAVIAIADFFFQRWKFNKDLMMTKQEVKEENKQSEGDPLVKSHIKSKQFEMARRRMIKDIPTADVVITNPTHFAVALKYELGKSGAPKVVAKGMDHLAQRIKQIAAEHNVPMHEDVFLARSLYKACDVGDEIPEKLFKAVAQILAYVYQLKNSKKKSIV